MREIEDGFESTRAALADPDAVAPFFRIPGLLRADGVEGYLASRGIMTWSADVPADDWRRITAHEVVKRSISRLEAKGKGILLLHDIQPVTVLALPALLREFKVVASGSCMWCPRPLIDRRLRPNPSNGPSPARARTSRGRAR